MQKNKPDVYFIGSDDFINSMMELKEDLKFNIVPLKDYQDIRINENNPLLIEFNSLKDRSKINQVNSLKSNLKIVISNSKSNINFNHDILINLPLNISNLNKLILQKITSKIFNENSSVEIKGYLLDKNERKLKKNNSSVELTEKEIKLLETLLVKKKPISKKQILTEVWSYASDVDTHTVETHIYRLRKKIMDEFQDENFLISEKIGYSI